MGNPSSSMGRGPRGCDDHHLISEDVLIQILLWLPVISLLRFKSVCKSWRSIIESPFFIHLHHATTTFPTSSVSTATTLDGSSSSSSSSVLINLSKGKILTLSGEEEFELFFEDLVIPATLWEYILSDEMFEGLNGGMLKDDVELLMVGCCDGIICLHDYFTRHVALWNPAIKQSRILPKPSNLLGFSKTCFKRLVDDDDGCDCEDFVRFGIDIKTNDYKVLLITTYKLRKNNYGTDPEDDGEEDRRSLRNAYRRIHVYCLSTDSWKCIANADANANANTTLYAAAASASAVVHPDDLYISIDKNEGGLYLNGSYFFTATCFSIEEGVNNEHRTMDMSLLLSFDFTGEIFKTIEPPFDLRNNYDLGDVYFIRLGDKVALTDVKQEFFEYNITEFTIWVLNDQQHGVKESWTKSYTIEPPDRFLINQPLFITNNGEFAVIYEEYRQDDRRHAFLRLLNLITGEKKLLRRDCQDLDRKFVHVYKPSLMPICGNGAAHT